MAQWTRRYFRCAQGKDKTNKKQTREVQKQRLIKIKIKFE